MARSFTSASATDVNYGTFSVGTGQALTITAWIYVTTFENGGRILTKQEPGFSDANAHVWMVSLINTDDIRFRLKTGTADLAGTTTLVGSSGGVTTNTWHHVAATYDGSDMRLYLDGVEDATSASKTGNIRVNGWPTTIGEDSDGNNDYTGRLAEMTINTATLTVDELLALARGSSILSVHPENLELYSPVWGNSPEPDLSGNQRNGTVTNTTVVDHAPVQRWPLLPTYYPLGSAAPPAGFAHSQGCVFG